MAVFVDRGYRTGLGTGFYDRVGELDEFGRLVDSYKLVVVYGPRNAGKSELVRYWARRRSRRRFVAFQADRLRAARSLEDLKAYLEAPEEGLKNLILSRLERASLERLNVGALVYIAYQVARSLAGETVVVVDEFHMLPDYEEPREAVRDLEALAHWLAKGGVEGLRAVVTVSDGFIATGEAHARLFGYNATFMLVEEMKEEGFRALYREYRELRGCEANYDLIVSLAGRNPGYLEELCRGKGSILKFVEASKTTLENAVSRLIDRMKGEDPRRLLELAYRVLEGEEVRPLEKPTLYRVATLLVESNVAYPRREPTSFTFKPQAPVYKLLLKTMLEKGLLSALRVNALGLVERLQRTQGG